MRFNIPLKTVMVLTLLTWPTVMPAPGSAGTPNDFYDTWLTVLLFGAPGAGQNDDRLGGYAAPRTYDEEGVWEGYPSRIGTGANGVWDGDRLSRIEHLQALVSAPDASQHWGGTLTYAALQAELFQLQGDELGRKTIVGVAEDGTKTTIECNPGPCTMGSVLKHARLSGLPMMVPLTLYQAIKDLDQMYDLANGNAFEETIKFMYTSDFRGTDANAESAYNVPAITTKTNQESIARAQNKVETVITRDSRTTTTTTTYTTITTEAAETEEEIADTETEEEIAATVTTEAAW